MSAEVAVGLEELAKERTSSVRVLVALRLMKLVDEQASNDCTKRLLTKLLWKASDNSKNISSEKPDEKSSEQIRKQAYSLAIKLILRRGIVGKKKIGHLVKAVKTEMRLARLVDRIS